MNMKSMIFNNRNYIIGRDLRAANIACVIMEHLPQQPMFRFYDRITHTVVKHQYDGKTLNNLVPLVSIQILTIHRPHRVSV